MRDSIRVKRGMVFLYNIDPTVDKLNVPTVSSRGKEYKDHLLYGWRPYLVVSNDIHNINSYTCNIVPLSSQGREDIPTHVPYNDKDGVQYILCEYVHTVNAIELTKYLFSLSDEVMERVSDALASQLGLKKTYVPEVEASLEKIESIIDNIVKKKVEEFTATQVRDRVNIEDTILRIGEGLEALFTDSKVEEPKKEEPKVEETPVVKKKSTEKKSKDTKKNRRRKWTEDSMRQFLKDIEERSAEDVISLYSLKDMQDYQKNRYYVRKRLEKMEVRE